MNNTTTPLLYDQSQYHHDKKEVSFIYECLFGGNLTSLARQIHFLLELLLKYRSQKLSVPKIPIIFCNQGDNIQFSINKIIVPLTVADSYHLALHEKHIGQLEKITNQASIAIFLSVFANNKKTNIAHLFIANALTHYNIRRRARNKPTLHKITPIESDKLFISLLQSYKSPKDAIAFLKSLSTQLIKYNLEPIPPLPNIQQQSNKILTPTIIHSIQIIGLANNHFNIPPSIVTNAKRALTKSVNTLFKNQ